MDDDAPLDVQMLGNDPICSRFKQGDYMNVPLYIRRFLAFVIVIGFAIFSVYEARETANEASHAASQSKEAAKQASQNAIDIRMGLIESCEKNGNPLRKVVQSILQEDIEGTKNRDQIKEFFPQIPDAKIDALIAKQVRAAQIKQDEIEPIDCARQYSPQADGSD